MNFKLLCFLRHTMTFFTFFDTWHLLDILCCLKKTKTYDFLFIFSVKLYYDLYFVFFNIRFLLFLTLTFHFYQQYSMTFFHIFSHTILGSIFCIFRHVFCFFQTYYTVLCRFTFLFDILHYNAFFQILNYDLFFQVFYELCFFPTWLLHIFWYTILWRIWKTCYNMIVYVFLNTKVFSTHYTTFFKISDKLYDEVAFFKNIILCPNKRHSYEKIHEKRS